MKFKEMNAIEKATYLNDKFFEIDGKLYHRELDHHLKGFGPVGNDDGYGYLKVRIDGKMERVHRIIYAMHHGYIPENVVDHIDNNPLNNRIENLQEASQSCNMRKACRKIGKSGVLGIYAAGPSWQPRISVNDRLVNGRTCSNRLDALYEWVNLIYQLPGFMDNCTAPALQHNFDIIERDERMLGLI